MPKAWRATSTIEWGKKTATGVVRKTFKPGDLVTGPSAEEMKALWEAGSLEETTVESSPSGEESAAESKKEVATPPPTSNPPSDSGKSTGGGSSSSKSG